MNNHKIIEDIKTDIECEICYETFINLTYRNYDKFLIDNKHLLPENFDNDMSCLLYEDRFECSCCKNIICQRCYWSFENHKFKPPYEHIEDYEYFDELDENGMINGCPGEDCPIICPFCKTKDYKIFYRNQIPYELLNEIKNIRLKYDN
jgi:hypothetical protein